MSTRIRRIVTAIDAKGNAFAEAHTETEVGDKWYPNDPVSLDLAGPEADEWKATFNAATLAENKSMAIERDSLVTQVASLTKERDEALAKLETTTAESLQLSLQLAEQTEARTTIEAAYNEKAQELADLYEHCGDMPPIAECKRQKELAAVESEIAAAIARKAKLESEAMAGTL